MKSIEDLQTPERFSGSGALSVILNKLDTFYIMFLLKAQTVCQSQGTNFIQLQVIQEFSESVAELEDVPVNWILQLK